MRVKVRFRFNKAPGEVEMFEVDHEGAKRLSDAEHNRQHDRIAAEVGSVLERHPQVAEVFPGAEKLKTKTMTEKPEAEPEEEEAPKASEAGNKRRQKE